MHPRSNFGIRSPSNDLKAQCPNEDPAKVWYVSNCVVKTPPLGGLKKTMLVITLKTSAWRSL